MGVWVSPEAAASIRARDGRVQLVVRTQADEELVASAVRAFAHELGQYAEEGLEEVPPEFSGADWIPRGLLVEVAGGEASVERLSVLPEVLARHLREAGVGEAAIEAAEPAGPLADTDLRDVAGPAVVLWLFPPPVAFARLARVPAGWLEPAVDWVAAGLGEHARVWGSVGRLSFLLTVAQAREFVAAKHAREDFGAWVVAGDYPHRFRAVSAAFFGLQPCVAVAGGGPGASEADQLAVFEELAGLAEQLADAQLGWAGITIEPSFAMFASARPRSTWRNRIGRPDSEITTQGAVYIVDEVAPEACPFQVLSPRHVARLGEPPAGARPLGDGRLAVRLGEPAAWLLDSLPARRRLSQLDGCRRDPQVQQRARQALAPLMVADVRDIDAIQTARFGDPRRS